jgi:hypothetical protein
VKTSVSPFIFPLPILVASDSCASQTKAAAFKSAQTVKEVKKYAFYAAVGGAVAFAIYWAVGRFGGKQAEKSKK